MAELESARSDARVLFNLNSQCPGAGGDLPVSMDAAFSGDGDFVVECDGGADVPWDAVEDIADLEGGGLGRFEDEMFLAVNDRIRVVEIEENDAWMRHFGCDSFVA